MTNEDPDQLVTITTATSEFTAHILIAILDDAGSNAMSCGSTGTALGVTGQVANARWGVPVQVRRGDADAAKSVLLANRRDSIDIDWDMVDVGQPGSSIPTMPHPPIAARVGWLVAATLVVLGLVLGLIIIFGG